MALTTNFRLIVECYEEGRRNDYYDAHLAFLEKIKPISLALGLSEPQMGNDARYTPDELPDPSADHYAFRLQLILAKNITPPDLSKFLSLAVYLNESLPKVTSWVEPTSAVY